MSLFLAYICSKSSKPQPEIIIDWPVGIFKSVNLSIPTEKL